MANPTKVEIILADKKEEIKNLYISDRKSLVNIAKTYKVTERGVSKALKAWGVPIRKPEEARRKVTIDYTYFEKIDTEDKAYFLGLLYADGTVGKNKIQISLMDEDKDILFRLKEYIKYDIPIMLWAKEKEKRFKARDSYFLTIHSKKVSQDIIKLGCTERKTYTLKFPDFNIVPENLMNHFIRGYFDGDGCLYTYSWRNPRHCSIIFVSSKIFCLGLKDYMNKIFKDINCCIYDKANEIAELRFFGIKKTLRFLDFLYENSINFFKRKHDNYLKLKEFL